MVFLSFEKLTLKEFAFVNNVRLFSFSEAILYSLMSVSRLLKDASSDLFLSFTLTISLILSFRLKVFSCDTVAFIFFSNAATYLKCAD